MVDVARDVGSFVIAHPGVIALGAVAILAAPIDLPLGVAATVEVVGQAASILGAGKAVHHAYDACASDWNSWSCLTAAAAAGIDVATLAAGDRVADALARRGVEFLTPEQLKRLIAAQIEIGKTGVEALLDRICEE